MCGLAGFVEIASVSVDQLTAIGRAMAEAIAHRGPDDHGIWADAESGVCLAHRRLAIVDLSPHGHQPMSSHTGRYVLVFNGELYNFRELRARLDKERASIPWRGHSDTEVLLAAFDAWGIDKTLPLANGMFAFAVFDRTESTLTLARDRFGEKPLYYGWQGTTFMFASELKGLLSHPRFQRRLAPHVLPLFLRFGYVPGAHCVYAGISKLQAGHMLRLPTGLAGHLPSQQPYWRVPVPRPRAALDERVAVDELDALLRAAVRTRMEADVPLGAFLSGGIDSSTIVAVAQSESRVPVRTFSIGFADREVDESAHARAVASVLGTAHTELKVTAADALATVPALSLAYDEPFADSSQIPTLLLARLTRAHVTVTLSGDGGDELFGGYHRYLYGARLAALRAVVPLACRALGARMLARIPGRRWEQLLNYGPRQAAVVLGADRLTKLAAAIAAPDARSFYKAMVSQWIHPASIARHSSEPATLIDDTQHLADIDSPIAWMMYMDLQTYLPDDILTKVDRATMASALEARVPFLDPAVADYAAGLPMQLKIRGTTGKWLLRQVLYRYVDRQLFQRPKQGFAIPLSTWLRGPLRDWADDLLSERALADSGLFHPKPIQDAWRAHVAGRANMAPALWVVLMFQAWYRRYQPSVA